MQPFVRHTGVVAPMDRVNVDMTRGDQQSYMRYARKLATEPGFLGDRNRMPLYPALQSLVYDESLSDEAYFLQSKLINLLPYLAVLTLLAWSPAVDDLARRSAPGKVTLRYLSQSGSQSPQDLTAWAR